MPGLESRFEVERIENLVGNFGWKVVKQEIKDDEIVLKILKPIVSPGEAVDTKAKAAIPK